MFIWTLTSIDFPTCFIVQFLNMIDSYQYCKKYLKFHISSIYFFSGGTDMIHFNSNRQYGRIMLPHMFANWNQIYSTYRNFPDSPSEIKAGDFCPDAESNLMWCFQPMTVLEKPKTP